jgi:dolichyl-phosphate-mannose--protein O-mannosyl transferase
MKRPLPFAALLLLGGTIVATYIWWFYVHFAILWKTNDREKAFIPVEFSAPYIKTLVGHPEYEVWTGFSL